MGRTETRFSGLATALLFFATACQGGGDDMAGEELQDPAIVATGSPPSSLSSTVDLAPLAVSGSFSTPEWNSVKYTDGRDLVGPPMGGPVIPDESTVAFNTAAWKSRMVGTFDLSAPKLGSYLDLAIAQSAAKTDKSKLAAGSVKTLFDLIAFLGGPTPNTTTKYSFSGYAPLRARWLNGQRISDAYGSRWVSYSDPPELADLRERGARLYCAAKAAQAQQNTEVLTMGEQVGFSTTVLGKQIDFMVVEPTVVLDAPSRYTALDVAGSGPNYFALPDGAQSFNVPMQFGTRITPIRGLGIPGLSEMRYPVALTSADSEVRTSALLQSGAFAKRYMTVTHGDAIASSFETINAQASVLLFSTGLISVKLGLALDFDLGKPRTNEPLYTQTRFDERVLHVANLVPGFPGTPGFLGSFGLPIRERSQVYGVNSIDGYAWHDGAWTPPPPCIIREFNNCPTWNWQVLNPGFTPWWSTTKANVGALNTRAWQDDDHYYETRTALSLTGSLIGSAGFDHIGPFALSFEVQGGLKATAGQSHMVRDALTAEVVPGVGARAVTNLSVRPRTDAKASLIPTTGTMHLAIDLGWFGSVHWDPKIFEIAEVTLAEYDSEKDHAWKESASLRIGTGSSKGDSMKKPDVYSHLPGKASFASFPQDVDSCLSDPPSTLAPPPVCAAKPTVGVAPYGYVCAYAKLPGNDIVNVCGDMAGTITKMGLSDEAARCWKGYLEFLCSGFHTVGGAASVTHLMDAGSALTIQTAMSRLGSVQKQCVNLMVPYTGNAAADNASAKKFMDSFFKLGLCKPDGTLFAPTEIIGIAGDPYKTPTPTAPAPCK